MNATTLFIAFFIVTIIIAGFVFWQLLKIHELVNSRFSATEKALEDSNSKLHVMQKEVERLGGAKAPVHESGSD